MWTWIVCLGAHVWSDLLHAVLRGTLVCAYPVLNTWGIQTYSASERSSACACLPPKWLWIEVSRCIRCREWAQMEEKNRQLTGLTKAPWHKRSNSFISCLRNLSFRGMSTLCSVFLRPPWQLDDQEVARSCRAEIGEQSERWGCLPPSAFVLLITISLNPDL